MRLLLIGLGMGMLWVSSIVSAEEIGFYKLIRKSDGAVIGAGYSQFEHHDPAQFEVQSAVPESAFAEVEVEKVKIAKAQKDAEKNQTTEIPLSDFGGLVGGMAGAASLMIVARKKKAGG